MPNEPYFTSELFKFLRQLKRHNNREWFQAKKERYEILVRDPFLKFIEDFGPRLHRVSPHFIADPKRSGGSLLRIYKDLRFRPDAPPYQTMAAARFPHAAWKQVQAPGFYLHLEPGRSFFAMGLWHPDPETREKVREAIVSNSTEWKKATSGKRFTTLCRFEGELMKRMPPGYDANHPLADDLRRKDFTCWKEFSENEVCAPDFLDRVTGVCEAAGPFMEFLTRAVGLPWSKEDRARTRDPLSVESSQRS
jgi:uncharacterized protein (TIGR02453 family)